MKKVAITYMQYGVVYKKILFITNLYTIANEIVAFNIQENEILKIEFILEAEDHNITDETL